MDLFCLTNNSKGDGTMCEIILEYRGTVLGAKSFRYEIIV